MTIIDGEKILCPKCGELDAQDIGFWQDGRSFYNIIVHNDHIDFELDEFDDDGGDCAWYCKKCWKEILTTSIEIIDATFLKG